MDHYVASQQNFKIKKELWQEWNEENMLERGIANNVSN